MGFRRVNPPLTLGISYATRVGENGDVIYRDAVTVRARRDREPPRERGAGSARACRAKPNCGAKINGCAERERADPKGAAAGGWRLAAGTRRDGYALLTPAITSRYRTHLRKHQSRVVQGGHHIIARGSARTLCAIADPMRREMRAARHHCGMCED